MLCSTEQITDSRPLCSFHGLTILSVIVGATIVIGEMAFFSRGSTIENAVNAEPSAAKTSTAKKPTEVRAIWMWGSSVSRRRRRTSLYDSRDVQI